MTTTAEQNYVKAIYKLQEQYNDVSTSLLAANLGITAPSVSGMLKKLSRAKIVIHNRRKGVRLTRKGKQLALNIIRRHRLVELFLVETLGMTWDNVHIEAEKLEHSISDTVLAHIDKLLGYPKCDPHGSPIPSADGSIPARKAVQLVDLQLNQEGVICEVEDDKPEMLQHLREIGLIPGANIRIIDILAADGTLIIKCNHRQQAVSPTIASAVWVDEVK